MSSSSSDRIGSPLLVGFVAAVQTLFVSLLACWAPAAVAFVAASHTRATAVDVFTFSLDVWLVAQGAPLTLTLTRLQGPFSIIPLGLTLVVLWACAAGARRIGRAIGLFSADGDLYADRLRSAAGGLIVFAIVYTGGAFAVSSLADSTTVRPLTTGVAVGAATCSLVGGFVGMAGAGRRRGRGPRWYEVVTDLIPAPWGPALRGAMAGVLALVAGAFLALCITLFVELPSTAGLFSQLDPGPWGGLVLVLVQIALLPNLAVNALLLLVGSSFTLGAGTSFSAGGFVPGVTPALPALAALPGPGDAPGWMPVLLVVPVLAGVLIGLLTARRCPDDMGWVKTLAGVVLAVVLTSAAVALMVALAGGSIGDARLADLGGDPLDAAWRTALWTGIGALIAWVLVGTGVVAAADRLRLSLHSRLEAIEQRDRRADTGDRTQHGAHELDRTPDRRPAGLDLPDAPTAVPTLAAGPMRPGPPGSEEDAADDGEDDVMLTDSDLIDLDELHDAALLDGVDEESAQDLLSRADAEGDDPAGSRDAARLDGAEPGSGRRQPPRRSDSQSET